MFSRPEPLGAKGVATDLNVVLINHNLLGAKDVANELGVVLSEP